MTVRPHSISPSGVEEAERLTRKAARAGPCNGIEAAFQVMAWSRFAVATIPFDKPFRRAQGTEPAEVPRA